MSPRTGELFEQAMSANYRRTSRLFVALMAVQWLFGVGVSLWWSPLAWAGRSASIHVHVWAAMILGAAISSLPIWLALTRPSASVTRYVIAAAQMLWSALLIHLTGGRIETHFHVFGSLAFLAFYRDWKVLVPATVVVAADHFLRGLLWPESVYGVANAEWWRFVEHALWVAFENAVLVLSCVRGRAEVRLMAERQAQVESSLEGLNALNHDLDRRVAERTAHLERTQAELVEASRRAGKADVATAVLHNVGNALNSINVSCSVLLETVRSSRVGRVKQASALLAKPDVARLLEGHARAGQLQSYLEKLSDELERQHGVMGSELGDLQRNLEHVKVIVSMQQAHAKNVAGVLETASFSQVVEDALRLAGAARTDKEIQLIRELETLPEALVDRHKVFQILMNLFSNARHAIKATGRAGLITARLTRRGDMARLEVADDGCGIAPGDMSRIFALGFTTRKEGHGFGLHSSACAAAEMGGKLSCTSEGPGRGATFVLELPLHVQRAAA